MKSKVKILIILILTLTSLTGCWDSHELNKMAFVTSLGFDKSADGITVTAQILNPRAIAAQKGTNESTVVVVSEQGHSIFDIIRRMSTKLSRQTTGTHMQTVVFGENFAKSGIAETADFLLRRYQNSSEIYFTVAKGKTASDVLINLTKLENNPSIKLNSSLQISEKVWAATKATKLTELINSMVSNGKNPVLTGINLNENSKVTSLEDLKSTQNDPIQLSGNALFIKDKLVGWMDEDQSKGYNFIDGNVDHSVGYIDNPDTGRVTLEVTKVNSQQKMILSDNKPEIDLSIQVISKIETVNSNFDVTKEENLNKIENIADQKLESMCKSSIDNAKSLKSDIFGFGDIIHRSNPKLWESVKNSWNNSGFVNLPVHINVQFKIISTDTINKSFISGKG